MPAGCEATHAECTYVWVVGVELEMIGEMRDIEDETDFVEVCVHRMDETVDGQMPEFVCFV